MSYSAHTVASLFSNALSSPCCLYWYWCKGSSSCGTGCGWLLLPSVEEMTCCKSWDLPIIASGYFHYTVSFYVWFFLSTSSQSLTSLQAIFLSLCFYTELSFLMFFAFPNSVNKGSKTTLFAHRGISQIDECRFGYEMVCKFILSGCSAGQKVSLLQSFPVFLFFLSNQAQVHSQTHVVLSKRHTTDELHCKWL